MTRRHIESLAGEILSAVAFVMDYVEFHFNGPVLRAFTNSVVEALGSQIAFGQPGSRDALWSLIGAEVGTVEVRDEDFIRITFTDGRQLTIPLAQASRTGPEAATFHGELVHSPLDVW